jgi:dTDP-glucose 4,6-dehydratase
LPREGFILGPHFPSNTHFPIGNFDRDGLQGEPIQVREDGTAYCSYLHTVDLAVRLWTILLRGQTGRPYYVGSALAFSIADVARLVGDSFVPALPVRIAKAPVAGAPVERYVPSVERAREELGLHPLTTTPEAIRKTIRWHRPIETRSPAVEFCRDERGHTSRGVVKAPKAGDNR